MHYILASKSPRRRELLSEMGIPFRIETRETDETLPSGIHPREGVRLLAERKAMALPAYDEETVVIAADTLVEADGLPLGKPRDPADARAMLRALSSRAHNVHTGVAVRRGERLLSSVVTTAVFFRALTEEEIDAYVASGEPMDKAGAYGIQGGAAKFVSRYEGAYDNVVGLPCELLKSLLAEVTHE